MSTPAIQTLITQAQQVLNLKSSNEIRATFAAILANANVGTPLNPNLTTQQLWNEFYEIVRQPTDDIMSIITDQMMRMVYAPPAPGGAGADKQVIFNDGGVLAGDTKFLWDKTANRLDVDGPVVITGALDAAGLNVTGTAIPANGMYLGAANVLSFSAASALGFTLNSIGMGVNRTAAAYRFEVFGNAQIIQSNFVDVALRISQGTATTGNKSQLLFTDSTGTISYVTGYGSAFGPPYNKALALGTNGADRVLVDSAGNVAIGVGAFTFGTSAANVLGLANATAPSTSPAGMGQLYVEAGSLKYRGTSGLVTVLALA